MIYKVNDQLRSTILDDNTAEARLENILAVMEQETFGQRKAAMMVGGLKRLERLMEEGKVTMRRRKRNEEGKRKKKSRCRAA